MTISGMAALDPLSSDMPSIPFIFTTFHIPLLKARMRPGHR
jgi:hypothetical protein